MISKHVLGQM
jgi:serine/threonine protein kinase